jgi:hypothetical protein
MDVFFAIIIVGGLWGLSIWTCRRIAKKKGWSTVLAVVIGLIAPIVGPAVYFYTDSNFYKKLHSGPKSKGLKKWSFLLGGIFLIWSGLNLGFYDSESGTTDNNVGMILFVAGGIYLIRIGNKKYSSVQKNDSSAKKVEVVTSSYDDEESSNKTHTIGEESVFKRQTAFEKKLYEEVDFPDGIRGADVYVYKSLMCVWYRKLSSENRYNEEMTQKLRNDWLDYMNAMEDRSTSLYLSMELYDEKDNTQSESYRNDHIIESRKMFAIEEAFASAVGKEEVKELARIRDLSSLGNFDKFGNLAPKGFSYDLLGKLKPIKK